MTRSQLERFLDGVAACESSWYGPELTDPTRWTHTLGVDEQTELRRLAIRFRDRPLASLTARDLPSDGALATAAAPWRRELATGLGFVLVRGFPVDDLTGDDLVRAWLLLGLALGTPAPQNLDGELVTHVRDTGADPHLAQTRLYTTRAEQDFHTDAADIIGLLCRRGARSGGVSRIVSSGAIVSTIWRTRPDLVRTLFDPFSWHYQEPGRPAAWFARPICRVPAAARPGAGLNTFFIPWYIRRSQELPEAPRLSAVQLEAIAMIEQLANDPAFHLDMTFEPGDVQWLKNAAILHKRTAYEDHAAPADKRHLLRLWLSAPDFADGDEALRAGVNAERLVTR